MACTTSYAFTGTTEDMDDFSKRLEKFMDFENQAVKRTPNPYGETYLGDLLEYFGIDSSEYDCSGTVEWVNRFRNSIQVDTETEEHQTPEVFEAILLKEYPASKAKSRMKYVYISDCPEAEVFEKNDAEGRFYPANYQVEIGLGSIAYHQNDEDLLIDISRVIKKRLHSVTEAYAEVEEWNEEHESIDDKIRIHEYKLII